MADGFEGRGEDAEKIVGRCAGQNRKNREKIGGGAKASGSERLPEDGVRVGEADGGGVDGERGVGAGELESAEDRSAGGIREKRAGEGCLPKSGEARILGA